MLCSSRHENEVTPQACVNYCLLQTMFFHHVQEVDDPASDGDSDHSDSEGSVNSKNTCECAISLSSLSETEKVHVAIVTMLSYQIFV